MLKTSSLIVRIYALLAAVTMVKPVDLDRVEISQASDLSRPVT
jgi:hypothetical protein